MTCDNLLQLSLCIGGTRPQPHSPEVLRNIAFTCSFVCPFLHWTNASGGPDTALCARDSVALMKQTGAVLPRGSRSLRPMEAVIYEPIPGWWVLTWFPFLLPPSIFMHFVRIQFWKWSRHAEGRAHRQHESSKVGSSTRSPNHRRESVSPRLPRTWV